MSEFPSRYEAIALSNESTVVAEFIPEEVREASYQSEAALERDLIAQLQKQAYDYLPITSEADLIANLRAQLEALNRLSFSDAEWQRFFSTCIAGANDGIVEKTARIQEDHVQLLKRDDGSTKNIYLIDKRSIHNNRLQVINQYEAPKDEQGAGRATRFDVTILVNGLPMVHVELKRRGVDIREAFNQINRYQRDSFWAGSGLFEYVQLFVISNGTLTKYYSNTVRDGHLAEQRGKRGRNKTSNSFAFTSWWADAKNQPITGLEGFARTFFAKHSLLNVLTRYCVFDVERKLLVMRPYQIVAAEQILQRIATGTNHRQLGTMSAGGYIWHTTGSGKTLTSFKAAQLARGLADVDKVLFVVDRKDLDYQTMREYERFEKGAANSNTSTAVLQRQLEDPNARIIITTIQKLSRFVAANRKHPVYDQHVVAIFDECHRSQFGDMHGEITRVFKRYHLFGFTGTPIFADNAGTAGNPLRRTTAQAFGDRLHTYTIVDAINDRNVLPFRIDYINTIRTAPGVKDKQVSAIDTERALLAPERISQIVGYIREHFDQKTKRAASYRMHGKRLAGFNSLFATASIDAAKRYSRSSPRSKRTCPRRSGSRWASSTALPPTRKTPTGCWARRDSKPRGWMKARATFWTPPSRTTTPCSAPASIPARTSSRTTTRTCRSA
jgi:type I restriction enzyme R subunit